MRARERLPDERRSVTKKFSLPDEGGELVDGYIHVGFYPDGRVGEVFAKVARQGDSLSGLLVGACRVASLALQHGASVEEVTRQWVGTRFPPAGLTGEAWLPFATSPLDYVGRYMQKVAPRGLDREVDGEIAPTAG